MNIENKATKNKNTTDNDGSSNTQNTLVYAVIENSPFTKIQDDTLSKIIDGKEHPQTNI